MSVCKIEKFILLRRAFVVGSQYTNVCKLPGKTLPCFLAKQWLQRSGEEYFRLHK